MGRGPKHWKWPGHPVTDVKPGNAAVNANIYATLEREGTAQVLVILQQQVDLSGADQLQAKADKGAFVYAQLIRMRTQDLRVMA